MVCCAWKDNNGVPSTILLIPESNRRVWFSMKVESIWLSGTRSDVFVRCHECCLWGHHRRSLQGMVAPLKEHHKGKHQPWCWHKCRPRPTRAPCWPPRRCEFVGFCTGRWYNFFFLALISCGKFSVHYIQWGEQEFDTLPILQVFLLTKHVEVCNLYHRYTSTVRSRSNIWSVPMKKSIDL